MVSCFYKLIKQNVVQIEAKITIESDYPNSVPQFKLSMKPEVNVDYNIPAHLEKLVDKKSLSKRKLADCRDTSLMDIEQELHYHVPLQVIKQTQENNDQVAIFYLLSYQIAHLMVCYDFDNVNVFRKKKCLNIYLEIEHSQSSIAYITTPKQGEVVLSKFCSRIAKGKNLQKPFDYCASTGLFVQRGQE